MADHFDLSPFDVHEGVDYVWFEDRATSEYVIVRVSDGAVLSRRRKWDNHQTTLRALGGTRQHVYPHRVEGQVSS